MNQTKAPQLNSEQQQAVETAIKVARDAGHMSLIGPAGTGKTTTIRAIADRITNQRFSKRRPVLLLAPTHKAKQQFSAAALPVGTKCWTVARFCKVQPDEAWRDQDRFSSKFNNDLQTISQIAERFCFVIVDEASMVPHDLASTIVDICGSAGIGVMFAGDPFQLPPVSKNQQMDPDDVLDGNESLNGEISESTQAPEFLSAPIIASLQTVMRHGGPILSFATNIRANWEILHGFPSNNIATDESAIKISTDPSSDFIKHFSNTMEASEGNQSTLYAKAPRALCHQNNTVNRLTKLLRQEIYGESANKSWQVGELISFPRYTRTQSQSIYPSFDAVVVNSEIVDLDRSYMEAVIPYSTQQKQIAKEISFSFPGRFQEVTVVLIKPDGTEDVNGTYVVYAPLCDDKDIKKLYAEASLKLRSRRLCSDHAAWKWLKNFKDTYLTPIYSAFVMTVHKSQGSTFEHVYVSRDLLFCDEIGTRNPLLYVAATRASKSITFSGGYVND